MRTEQVNEMIADITRQLLQKRSSDGVWRGCLSSSAISTSVAIFALYQIDSDTYEPYIRKGAGWLKKTMRADGSWGGSVLPCFRMLLYMRWIYRLMRQKPI